MPSKRTFLKDRYGRIIGTIDRDTKTGNETAKDFYGVVLGFYKKKQNFTTDFSGKVLTEGNTLSALIIEADNKRNNK